MFAFSFRRLLLFFMTCLLSISSVQAIGLSTYRIYLDKNHNQQNFVVYNRDPFTQDCTIKNRHFSFDSNGDKKEFEAGVLPDFAADKWLRFSPKKFRVEAGQMQNVRFKMRRKSNVAAKEYRTYISLDCNIDLTTASRDIKGNLKLAPKLRHNVPVIVRTGEIEAKMFFDNVSIDGNVVSFTFNKEGERSTYGEFVLFDKESKRIVAKKPSVSLHMEVTRKNSLLAATGDVDMDDLILQFVENKELSGQQVVKYPLKIKL